MRRLFALYGFWLMVHENSTIGTEGAKVLWVTLWEVLIKNGTYMRMYGESD